LSAQGCQVQLKVSADINAKSTIIQNLITRIEVELKKDELFKLLFQRFHNTGSFYDELACCD